MKLKVIIYKYIKQTVRIWQKSWKWHTYDYNLGSPRILLSLCNPMDCSLLGSSVHGISQARLPEWVAVSFSRRSSQPRDRTQVSCISGRFFTIWATREAPEYNSLSQTLGARCVLEFRISHALLDTPRCNWNSTLKSNTVSSAVKHMNRINKVYK